MFAARIRKIEFERRMMKKRAERFLVRWVFHYAKFCRVGMRSKISRRKRTSKPGEGPSNRLGYLKKGILYAVDRVNLTAVVGVQQRSRSKVARVLEHGGNSESRDRKGKVSKFYVKPRPFVSPGFVKGVKDATKKQGRLIGKF